MPNKPESDTQSEIDWEVTIADGKYTLQHFAKGGGKALRYGEEWPARNVVGDNMMFAMGLEIVKLRQQLTTISPSTPIIDGGEYDTRPKVLASEYEQITKENYKLKQLLYNTGICSICSGTLSHHLDEPIVTCDGCGSISEDCTGANVLQQLRQQLTTLQLDKERLDWLDKCYDWQLRHKPNQFICKENEVSLRTAIDNARKETK